MRSTAAHDARTAIEAIPPTCSRGAKQTEETGSGDEIAAVQAMDLPADGGQHRELPRRSRATTGAPRLKSGQVQEADPRRARRDGQVRHAGRESITAANAAEQKDAGARRRLPPTRSSRPGPYHRDHRVVLFVSIGFGIRPPARWCARSTRPAPFWPAPPRGPHVRVEDAGLREITEMNRSLNATPETPSDP